MDIGNLLKTLVFTSVDKRNRRPPPRRPSSSRFDISMKLVITQSIKILLIFQSTGDSLNEELNVEITRTNESLCQRTYFEIRLRLSRLQESSLISSGHSLIMLVVAALSA